MSISRKKTNRDLVSYLRERLKLEEATPIGDLVLNNQVLMIVDIGELLRTWGRYRWTIVLDAEDWGAPSVNFRVPEDERWTLWYSHLVRTGGDRNIEGIRYYDASDANTVELCELTAAGEFHFPQDAAIHPLVLEPNDFCQIKFVGGSASTTYTWDLQIDREKTGKVRDLDGN